MPYMDKIKIKKIDSMITLWCKNIFRVIHDFWEAHSAELYGRLVFAG